MNTPEELKDYVIKIAESFGFKKKDNDSAKGNAVLRVDLEDKNGACYF